MRFLYNVFVGLALVSLKVIALFNNKVHLFLAGRKEVFQKLKCDLDPTQKTVWVHAASLGEFEQGRPLIEEIKKQYPEHQLLITFFSPSGYEVRKKYKGATAITYLPIDTVFNAKKFIKIVQPVLAVFIKYEFWPNYLIELKKNAIPTVLVSGIFRERQIFFKFYGVWMKKVLMSIDAFFVQDEGSKNLLNVIGIDEVYFVGDTRFDRVQKLVEKNEALPFVHDFKNKSYLLVAGSTWAKDEEGLVQYINTVAREDEKFIIAPHNIDVLGIEKLKSSLTKKTILYTQKEDKDLSCYQVMIVDTVGILSKIYAYANIAYVGGGYTKSGVHNTLEAATYGLPIVIGPNYKKFKEVKDLISLQGCTSVQNTEELMTALSLFSKDKNLREEKKQITKQYVVSNLGATKKIMETIQTLILR